MLPTGLQVVLDGGGPRVGTGRAAVAAPGETVQVLPDVYGAQGAMTVRMFGAPAGWTLDPGTGLVSGPMPATASTVGVIVQDSRRRSGRGTLTLTPRAARPSTPSLRTPRTAWPWWLARTWTGASAPLELPRP